MKSHLLLALAISFSTLFAQAQVKQDREVTSFHSIDVSGAFKVFLRMGPKCAVTVVADKEVIDEISTRVSNGELVVELDQDWWSWNSDVSKLEVYVTVTSLKSLDLSGACTLQTKNAIKGALINIDASGACKVDAEFSCDILQLDLSGATKMTLSGNCSKFSVDASGASTIYAADLHSKIVNIDASGACKAEVSASNVLNIDASGACKVLYKGSPIVNKEVSGASTVTSM